MLKAVIIEDTERDRIVLKNMLTSYRNVIRLVGEAESAQEGISLILNTKPDIVFLDVQLKHGDGFDVLMSFQDPDFIVIFTTTYDKYAIRAFQFSALDYFIKPINKELFHKTISKLILKQYSAEQIEKTRNFLSNVNSFSKIALHSQNSVRFVFIDDIIRCESESNYTSFYLRSGEKVLVTKSLKDYSDLLEPLNFFRAHNSHLINLKYVFEFKKGCGGIVIMEDKTEIYVSRRRKEQLMALLLK